MRVTTHGAVLLMLDGLMSLSAQAQRGADPAVDVGVAAVAVLRDGTGGRPLVLVHAENADTTVGQRIGAALGLPVWSIAESNRCRGFIPQCGPSTPSDTMSVRLTFEDVSQSRAVLVAESWGRAPGSSYDTAPRAFYGKRRLEFTLQAGRWTLHRTTWLLIT